MSEENIVENVENQGRDYESEARIQGWVPEEEFRGDKEAWIDAKAFIHRGEQINPILKQNNARLLKELDSTKKQLEELRATTEEFKKFQKEQYDRKAKELETEISKLREEKKQAISSGDGERAVEIDDRIDELREEKRQAKEEQKEEKPIIQPEQQVDPFLVIWLENNQWYSENVHMANVTNEEANRLHNLYPELQGKAFLEKLDEQLDSIFNPEKLGRKKKEKPRSPVEGTKGGSSNSNGKKGYSDLPSEAKAACDRFVKQKLMTQDQYLEMYEW